MIQYLTLGILVIFINKFDSKTKLITEDVEIK